MINFKYISFGVVLLCGIILIYCYYSTIFQNSDDLKSNLANYFLPEDENHNKTKYILYWLPFMGNSWNYYWGFGYEPFKDCEYSNCFTTKNRSLIHLEDFDAILFHAIYEERIHGKPKVRSPHQIYVLVNLESPANMYWLKFDSHKSYFNWTMTYRQDSDIIRPYGYVYKKRTNYTIPSKEFLQNKTGAAWFVSNCRTSSKREILVRELRKFYKIDVYGHCGNLNCSRKIKEKCLEMMEQKYKFYLSFENSYCKDYITEKLYTMLLRNVVPVVYNGGINNALIPSTSIINIEDFKDVRHLANYLDYLDSNTDEYIKYFEWKKDYVVSTKRTTSACELCRKLHQPLKTSIHKELDRWWGGGPNNRVCKGGRNLPEIVSRLLK